MEIGWYLRFKPGRTVRALVQKATRGQLENVRAMHPERTLEITEKDDHLEAVFRVAQKKQEPSPMPQR